MQEKQRNITTWSSNYFSFKFNGFIRKIYLSLVMLLFPGESHNLLVQDATVPSAERRVQAIEVRNEVEVINHQACAVISRHPECNMATNNLQLNTWL